MPTTTESPPVAVCPNNGPAEGSRGINEIMYVKGFDLWGNRLCKPKALYYYSSSNLWFFHIIQAYQLPTWALFSPPQFYFSFLKFMFLIERHWYFQFHLSRLKFIKRDLLSIGILNYVFKIVFDGKDAKLCTSLKPFRASLGMWLKTADVWYRLLLLLFGKWNLKYIVLFWNSSSNAI